MLHTSYITLSSVTAKVPYKTVVESLDDNGDGQIDPPVWASVAGTACQEVDSTLGQRFQTPFPAVPDVPAVVSQAALLFTCESIYLRRGFGTSETNPWMKPAAEMRATLKAIAKGDEPLTPNIDAPKPSVSFVTEPSRTSSRTGSLST